MNTKTFKSSWTETDETIITEKLTSKEIDVLISMRNCTDGDVMDVSFCFKDSIQNEFGYNKRTLSGILTSLEKKGFVLLNFNGRERERDLVTVSLTKEGARLFPSSPYLRAC